MTIPAARHVESVDGRANLQPDPRLVVLVPSQDFDASGLARRIWDRAAPGRQAVLYLGLCPNRSEEYRLRRRLITLAAVTRDVRVPVEIRIEFGNSWLRAVRSVWRTGDRILMAELNGSELARSLRGSLPGPVEVLSGIPQLAESAEPIRALRQGWMVPVVVATGLLGFEILLPRVSTQAAQSMLAVAGLWLGLGVIWLWTRSLG